MDSVINVNATWARNNFFDLLYAARDKKQVTVVTLDNEVVARIVPDFSGEFDWDNYMVNLEKAVLRLSKYDWSDVLEVRKKMKFRKYKGW